MKIVVTRASGGYRIELVEGEADPHALVVSEESEARALAFEWRSRLEESEGVPVELLWSAHSPSRECPSANQRARPEVRAKPPETQE